MNQFITTKRTLVAVILAVAMIFSASTIAAATEVEVKQYAHGELAYQYLEFIDENLPERIPFSPRERETAEWLVYELIKMGHSPENIYMQEFPIPEYMREMMSWWGDMFGEDLELLDYSQNVILTVPGESDKIIIVGAHYCSVNNNGISDNASGMVVLLESAKRMLQLEHYYTIVYIFFGAEEVGLYGANYFVASLTEEEMENIVLMINIDVIFDGSTLFYAAGFHDVNTSEMGSNAVTLLIDEIAQDLNEELDLGLVRQHNGIYVPSDHLPFVWAGFNVVVFHAVDGMEPMPPGAWMSFLDTVVLIEAMVHGTDDPELIETINEQRESLEWHLWWFLNDAENLPERIEQIEQMLNEESDPMFTGWLQEELEALQRIIALLEHPKMEEFEFQNEFTMWLSSSEELQLIEALIYGTNDPELIALIHQHSESLRWALSRYTSMEMEWLLKDIEWIRQQLRVEEDPRFIEWLKEDLERNERIIALLEHPNMEGLEIGFSGSMFFFYDLRLLEALVHGTDDPELIERLYWDRGHAEWALWWWLNYVENLAEKIESIEQQIRAIDNPIIIEWLQEDLEAARTITAFLEDPKVQEFEFSILGPISAIEEALLIQAMVFGTDDSEQRAAIHERRESLEWTLAWRASVGVESLLEDIEWMEELLKEETNLDVIETWKEHIDATRIIIDVLESPRMEQFVFQYAFDFDWSWWSPGFGYVLHTPNDNLTFINENWPGLIERALRSYSIFLENILTLPAQSLELVIN